MRAKYELHHTARHLCTSDEKVLDLGGIASRWMAKATIELPSSPPIRIKGMLHMMIVLESMPWVYICLCEHGY